MAAPRGPALTVELSKFGSPTIRSKCVIRSKVNVSHLNDAEVEAFIQGSYRAIDAAINHAVLGDAKPPSTMAPPITTAGSHHSASGAKGTRFISLTYSVAEDIIPKLDNLTEAPTNLLTVPWTLPPSGKKAITGRLEIIWKDRQQSQTYLALGVPPHCSAAAFRSVLSGLDFKVKSVQPASQEGRVNPCSGAFLVHLAADSTALPAAISLVDKLPPDEASQEPQTVSRAQIRFRPYNFLPVVALPAPSKPVASQPASYADAARKAPSSAPSHPEPADTKRSRPKRSRKQPPPKRAPPQPPAQPGVAPSYNHQTPMAPIRATQSDVSPSALAAHASSSDATMPGVYDSDTASDISLDDAEAVPFSAEHVANLTPGVKALGMCFKCGQSDHTLERCPTIHNNHWAINSTTGAPVADSAVGGGAEAVQTAFGAHV